MCVKGEEDKFMWSFICSNSLPSGHKGSLGVALAIWLLDIYTEAVFVPSRLKLCGPMWLCQFLSPFSLMTGNASDGSCSVTLMLKARANTLRHCSWWSEGRICMYVCALSCVWLFETLYTIAYQAPLSMEFSGWDYWSGFLLPPSGDLTQGSNPLLLYLLHLGNPKVWNKNNFLLLNPMMGFSP